MNPTTFNILIAVAGALALIYIIKPETRLVGVSALLICVALIAGKT